MGAFEFIVIIVAISCSVPILQAFFRQRGEARSAAQSEESQAQLRRLEERIQTLERIVTDRGYDLREQIDRLEVERHRS